MASSSYDELVKCNYNTITRSLLLNPPWRISIFHRNIIHLRFSYKLYRIQATVVFRLWKPYSILEVEAKLMKVGTLNKISPYTSWETTYTIQVATPSSKKTARRKTNICTKQTLKSSKQRHMWSHIAAKSSFLNFNTHLHPLKIQKVKEIYFQWTKTH